MGTSCQDGPERPDKDDGGLVRRSNYRVTATYKCMGYLRYFERWGNNLTTAGSPGLKLHRDLETYPTNMNIFFV
jgi:hypothetical protein